MNEIKSSDLKSKSTEELKVLLISLKKDLMKVRFTPVNEEVTDKSSKKKIKKSIARVMTFLKSN